LVTIRQPIRQSIAKLFYLKLFEQDDFFSISVKMSSIPDETTVEKLSSMLVDTSLPLKLRFRILFTLKNLDRQHQQQSEKTSAVVEAISRAFDDTSALLKHECAYCLGQMGNTSAIAKLIEILNDSNEDSMVRHEAGLR
jgi:HEAT repeat protein